MATCSSCGASIIFALNHTGTEQPYDREPTEDGNRMLLGRGPGNAPLAVPVEWVQPTPKWMAEADKGKVQRALSALGQCLYRPHHASCEFADRHRNG